MKKLLFSSLCLLLSCAKIAESICAAGQFQCANLKCIRESYVCDGDNDCGDRSDEQNCDRHQPCNLLDLNIPNADYNGCHVNTTVRYGREVTIQCHEGYTLMQPANVTCREQSRWSEIPKCIRACSTPELPNADYQFNTTEYEPGHRLTYLCNENYVTFQDHGRTHSHITCAPDGNWIPEKSGCTLKGSYGNVTAILVEINTLTSLICHMDENLNELDNDYFWLKNSVQLKNNTEEFTMDAKGTLTVKQMTENTKGHYTCFTTKPHIKPGHISYELKIKPSVCPLSTTEFEPYTFKEGVSAILKCPHTANDTQFTWFKNEHPLQINNDKTLLPDGVLYIKKVHESDKGEYTCQMVDKESSCERNHSITVKTLGSADSMCGSHDEGFAHPWITSLWQMDEIVPFCYGTLIHENWIITSAHCLENFYRKRKLSLFAQFNTGHNESKSRSLNVLAKSVKIHPQFSKKQYANDVGLVQLNKPVQFSSSIKPICLSEKQLIGVHKCSVQNITVVGWGPLRNEKYAQEILLEESMAIDRYCSSEGAFSHVCVEKKNDTVTTMAGDSGSPFEVAENERVYLLGIYSWGNRLTLHGDKDYYTNITSYIPWINSHIQNNEQLNVK